MRFNRYIIFVIAAVLTLMVVNQHEFDSNWDRPINSDGKGYYAFLPAVFIYQDLSYSFVDQMESTYYDADGSQAKAFKMVQPNGTVVNKCFPGTAIFYLPFFLIAIVLSWLFGFPIDGYSVLFQWSVAFSVLFYLLIGLYALKRIFSIRGFSARSSNISLLLVVFATNILFYSVVDFTVAHIFGFSGACVMLLLLHKFKVSQNFKYIAWTIPIFALLLLTRPTNAMLIILFLLVLNTTELKTLLNIKNWISTKHILLLLLSGFILFLAPLLWKLQSGNWLVYSYGNEKIDLTNPHFFEFLFSYIQGWWLWTPFMLVAFITGTWCFFRMEKLKGLIFFFGILTIAYVFSSWWSWTFGMSMGQRPMIEFYPILILGFAGFIDSRSKTLIVLLCIPLLALNVAQAYQMRHGIIVGGDTNKEKYWSHFLQLKKDPPNVIIPKSWEEVNKVSKVETVILTKGHEYSYSIDLGEVAVSSKIVIKAKISGKKDKTNAIMVLSDEKGFLYLAHYIKNDLYETPRFMSYLFEIEKIPEGVLKCYIWNPDSEYEVQLDALEAIQYRSKH